MALDARKEQFLKLIIENYIETAEPVGSQFLISKGGLKVSAATVRNVMRELEEDGYLTHPHTSAGRIPTEAGYRYYIEKFLHASKSKKGEMTRLRGASKSDGLKGVGKEIADMTENAVIVAMNPESVYYTGISNLFTQPEFENHAHALTVSQMFDRVEEYMDDLYALAENSGVHALVGTANPLGNGCGAIVARLSNNKLVVMIGPLRMDYEQGMRIARTIQEII
jgi:heat-inducible transcriptional repressor